MMSSVLDDSGAVVATKYDEWVAKEAGQRAYVMKQNRQLAEEQDANAKKQAGAGKAAGKKDKDKET